MLRFGQMFHQPQQAQPRRRHRAALRFIFKPFQLAKQGGAVEVELLCQRVALVSQTIGRGPLYGRLKRNAPTIRSMSDNRPALVGVLRVCIEPSTIPRGSTFGCRQHWLQ